MDIDIYIYIYISIYLYVYPINTFEALIESLEKCY